MLEITKTANSEPIALSFTLQLVLENRKKQFKLKGQLFQIVLLLKNINQIKVRKVTQNHFLSFDSITSNFCDSF